MPRRPKPYRKITPDAGKARVMVSGKRVYLPGEYGSKESRAAYQEVIDEYDLSQIANRRKVTGRTVLAGLKIVTVGELLVAYLGWYARERLGIIIDLESKTTFKDSQDKEFEHYRSAANLFALHAGTTLVNQLSLETMELVRRDMITGDRKANPQRQLHKALRRCGCGALQFLPEVGVYGGGHACA